MSTEPKKLSKAAKAAMLAVGRIIEPSKTEVTVEVEVEADGDPQDDILKDLGISFGDLDDLDIVEES